MGRKKKTEEAPKTNTKEIDLNSNTPILYKGSVQIQVKKGNRIISNKTKRNTGAIQMFKYLGYCLYGELKVNLAPNYIILLNKSVGDNDEIIHTRLSTPKFKSSTVINERQSKTITSKQFLLPYNTFKIVKDEEDRPLVCNEVVLTNAECLSYFTGDTLTEENLKQYSSAIISLDALQEIALGKLGIDDSLIIVWSMEITDISQGGNS